MRGKWKKTAALGVGLCALGLLTGCGAGVQSVRFKVNSEPEGGHVIYRHLADGGQGADWIYLGRTPLQVVRQYRAEDLEAKDRVSLKVLRDGYLEQVREWDGATLKAISDEQGVVIWAPRLVPSRSEGGR